MYSSFSYHEVFNATPVVPSQFCSKKFFEVRPKIQLYVITISKFTSGMTTCYNPSSKCKLHLLTQTLSLICVIFFFFLVSHYHLLLSHIQSLISPPHHPSLLHDHFNSDWYWSKTESKIHFRYLLSLSCVICLLLCDSAAFVIFIYRLTRDHRDVWYYIWFALCMCVCLFLVSVYVCVSE